jgi:hypothetical protein
LSGYKVIMNAQEARDCGLVDEVLEPVQATVTGGSRASAGAGWQRQGAAPR